MGGNGSGGKEEGGGWEGEGEVCVIAVGGIDAPGPANNTALYGHSLQSAYGIPAR